MTQAPQLINPPSGLTVWVVPRSDGSHTRGLVARVRLSGVLKIAVQSDKSKADKIYQ